MIPSDWQPETMMGTEAIEQYRGLVSGVPDGSSILELGTFHGGSIVALKDIILEKRIRVVGCDLFDYAPNPAPGILSESVWLEKRKGMLEKFETNIRRNGLWSNVRSLNRGDLSDAYFLGHLNLIFIDAGHTYEAVKQDIKECLPLLASNGILCGHDYCPDFPGVMRAVDEAFGPRPVNSATSIWVR